MKLINFLAICAFLCIFPTTIFGQTFKGTPINQRPVGAHRVIPRTDFSCRGRPAGYYADIETGCEIYHMCDGLGRQFSYACPNTTLFQQRMLICDHWYMVNCSRAESNYAANLLIGQRDKPFVGEEEHELRTPRPDLLDRPYSPDYSGESFRKHFKQTTPAVQNTISGTHIQPKASSGKIIESEGSLETAHSNYQGPQLFLPIHWSTKNGNVPDATASVRRDVKSEEFVPGNRRVDEVVETSENDGNAEIIVLPSPSGFSVPSKAPPTAPPVKNGSVKKPSLLYEAPFLLPDYNRNFRTQTAQVTTPSPQPNTPQIQSTGKPFTASGVKDPIGEKVSKTRNAPRTEPPVAPTARILSQNPFFANSLATKPTVATQQLNNRPNQAFPSPARDLLPPRTDVRKHDDATTEGPPIYYEWKWAVPAFVLEPPKPVNDSNVSATKKQPSTQAPVPKEFAHNPFLQRAFSGKGPASTSERSPTARAFSSPTATKSAPATEKPKLREPTNNYNELKKTLLIPDFQFPLEKDVRGFEQKEAKNSFQLVIPTKSDKPWYGENPKCPDCHPAYVQPGTCEPCIRIR